MGRTFKTFQDRVGYHLACRGVDHKSVSTQAVAQEHQLPIKEVNRILARFGAMSDPQVLLLTEEHLGVTQYQKLLFDWARMLQQEEKKRRRRTEGAPPTR